MNSYCAEIYGRRIAILLEKGHYEAARRVVDESEEREGRETGWDTPLEDLGLNSYHASILSNVGLHTANDVRHETYKSLQEIENIGQKGAREVMNILEKLK